MTKKTLVDLDPYLGPFAGAINERIDQLAATKAELGMTADDPGDITLGHQHLGFNRLDAAEAKAAGFAGAGVIYREWAPAAHRLSLIGDFNDWDRGQCPMTQDDHGTWSVFLPDEAYGHRLTHGSLVKVHVVSDAGAEDRIPAYIRRVVQEEGGVNFSGQYWCPPKKHDWQNPSPKHHLRESGKQGIRVYEAHVGMSMEEGKVASFDEFTLEILPRIRRLGYNAVQLMAVQEHPYYGSFGYHVSNLFAVSSRFGTPEQLKRLIDEAHGLGLLVIMDIVHSHMVKNTAEGLNNFDGTRYQYFHDGPRGEHEAWDSLCFDYSKHEVQRLLLSNVRYWLEEFRFDGFRFDGVTSMLYKDHGLGKSFSGYDDYFGENVDDDAVTYLSLANDVAHAINPESISVAEDMSGLPGIARPTSEGGVGFDYRLAMGVPDYWIKTLKEKPDEAWDLHELWHVLTNRRATEKHIGYAESHDQALVGDKTLAMRLLDKQMYEGMSLFTENLVVDRGIAMHKLIRLLTFTLSGEGYLNFMGNEFGHPEWIDFPREGNGYSYHYARRQWSLPDTDHLRYQYLQAFDVAMQALDQRYQLLTDPLMEQLALHKDTLQLVYRRGPLVFAFNLHPTESQPDLRIPVPDQTDYRLVLSTDAKRFNGQDRVQEEQTFVWEPKPMYGRDQTIQVYLPARSALVLAPVPPE